MNNDQIDALIKEGDLVRCACCGELSAFSWDYVTEKESYTRLGYEPGEIALVDGASCFEWGCGHCGAHNVPYASPLLAEVYTHVDPRLYEEFS